MEKVQETEFVPFDVWEDFNESTFSYFHKGVVICADDFRNDTPRKLYANFKAGIHTVYIAEIVGAWRKKGKE